MKTFFLILLITGFNAIILHSFIDTHFHSTFSPTGNALLFLFNTLMIQRKRWIQCLIQEHINSCRFNLMKPFVQYMDGVGDCVGREKRWDKMKYNKKLSYSAVINYLQLSLPRRSSPYWPKLPFLWSFSCSFFFRCFNVCLPLLFSWIFLRFQGKDSMAWLLPLMEFNGLPNHFFWLSIAENCNTLMYTLLTQFEPTCRGWTVQLRLCSLWVKCCGGYLCIWIIHICSAFVHVF